MGTNIRLGIGVPNARKKQEVEPVPPPFRASVTIIVKYDLSQGNQVPLQGLDLKVVNKSTGIQVTSGITDSTGEIKGIDLITGEYLVISNDPVFSFDKDISQNSFAVVRDEPLVIVNPIPIVQQSTTVETTDWFGSQLSDQGIISSYLIQNRMIPYVSSFSIPMPRNTEQKLEISVNESSSIKVWKPFNESVSIGSNGELIHSKGSGPIAFEPQTFNKIIFSFTRETGASIESGKITLKEANHPDWVEELVLVNGQGEIQLPSCGTQNTFVYNWAFSYEGMETFTGIVNLTDTDVSVVEMIKDAVVDGIRLTDIAGDKFSIYHVPVNPSIPLTVDWGDGDVEDLAPYRDTLHQFKTTGMHTVEISEPSGNTMMLLINQSTPSTIKNMSIRKFIKLQSFVLFNLESPNLDISSLVECSSVSFESCPNLNNIDFSGNTKLAGVTINKCPAFTQFSFVNNPLFGSLSLQGSTMTEFAYDYGTTFPTLKTLTLQNNTKLTSLSINNYSNLNNLTITNCPELSTCNIASAPITRLTGLNTLSKLTTFRFNTGASSISEIDLSNNPLLTSLWLYKLANLTTIKLNENTPTRDIRIKNNPLLSTITGLPKNGGGGFEIDGGSCPEHFIWSPESLDSLYINSTSVLKTFSVASGNIREINLEGNSGLTDIDCSDTSQLEAYYAASCPSLKTVNLSRSLLLQKPAQLQLIVSHLPTRTLGDKGVLTVNDTLVAATITVTCAAKFWDVV